MKVTETNLGFLIETPKFTALLGGQKANLANLQASFSGVDFIRIKQTHSDIVVHSMEPSLDYQVEADAHFTRLPRTALCISTADCIPLLIFDEKTELVASVHAGWRGVANQIVPKTLKTLQGLGASADHLHILVGPHIQMPSFEVSYEVRDAILSSIDFGAVQAESLYHRNLNSEKSLVDLNQVLKTQLENSGLSIDRVYNLSLDTLTDPRFHSHRRDKEKAGRQISFIYKN